ncbi:hypothetical protein HYPDE_27908 [Hyphomicrobium denitrificans 1NES1]|uniref:ATP-dependent Clp protease proteolytic subunit n=1 Tax=Hyphomicrobium denitrificans 1NES1 TaxID=670307 RepID=N0B9P3_9HYPH|nr:hypothetical protein [Hyphomicrobium denitrificans]AGK57261.1 hypothetical protein HYPDE_27908 [Hyphomicrobium denitrificans 1NES1]
MLVYFAVTLWVTQWSLQDTPVSRMAQGATGFLLIGTVAIWQLVGMWRASTRERNDGRRWITRWLARAVSALVGVTGFLLLMPFPGGMMSLYRDATDQDWVGLQGHIVSIDDTNLRITGYLAWGVLGEVSRALTANSDIRTVVLNSPGGHVGVGTRLYDEIRSRGLDTYAAEFCASACTLAFLGGTRRIVRPGAKLGFHAVGGESANSIGAGTDKIRSLFQAADIPEPFIQRVFATPSNSAWYPDQKELIGAHVVTDVVR